MDVSLSDSPAPSATAYRDALDYLFVRTTGVWRFGLERTNALLAALGNPHHALPVVHVGGTNGKGSVCATIECTLRARGFRTAMYSSPHLVDFRERITVDGKPVDADFIVRFVETHTPLIEQIGATFFEATTAMAFAAFAESRADVAIIEVGLGGRLDATNVVDPMLSIVTSVGVDHTEYLGETRAEIAREKAGIFKPDRAAIIGERDADIRALLRDAAQRARSSPICAVHDSGRVGNVVVNANGTSFTLDAGDGAEHFRTSLTGAHQADNAVVALCALDTLPPPFRTTRRDTAASLAQVRLPGRFDLRGKYLFDVAHNRDGARVLANTLRAVMPTRPLVCVLSVLADKDWRGMMEELAPCIDEFVFTTAPTSPQHRAWNPLNALAEAERRGWKARVIADFGEALSRSGAAAATTLITGSFHTVGDAMSRLQVSPHG